MEVRSTRRHEEVFACPNASVLPNSDLAHSGNDARWMAARAFRPTLHTWKTNMCRAPDAPDQSLAAD